MDIADVNAIAIIAFSSVLIAGFLMYIAFFKDKKASKSKR